MRKLVLIIITSILTVISTSAVATTGAHLTTQAKHILWNELANENVTNAHHPEITCLAENIYFEARAESYSGKAAVANVTKNRVKDLRWPSTFCGVVTDGPVRESWKTKQHKNLADSERVYYPRKHRCQFSWYCDGIKDVIWANKEKTGQTIEGNARAWREAVQIAIIITGHGSYEVTDNTMGAVFYYAHNLVYPSWADKKQYIGVLGNHTFMK
jgi:spore germination cell wall hydrolase CwlJ-like protein